jgi:hypothetical protein
MACTNRTEAMEVALWRLESNDCGIAFLLKCSNTKLRRLNAAVAGMEGPSRLLARECVFVV